jgi:hypothetical protein
MSSMQMQLRYQRPLTLTRHCEEAKTTKQSISQHSACRWIASPCGSQ